MRRFIALACILLGTPACAQQPRETRDVVYATTNGIQSRLDVYQNPSAGRAPVLVYFHGGSWTTGERPKSASFFRSFLAMGFSVLSVDYRLSDVARAPAAVQDARCAIAWVKTNADKYHFDTNRIVTYGTSAGGHLAVMAAVLPPANDIDLPACRDVPKVAAVLDYYGPVDVAGFARKSAATMAWLGDPAHAMELARTLSPASYVRAGLPPVLLIHGDADTTVPYAQSVTFRALLDSAGVPTRMYTVPGGLHGNFSEEQKRVIAGEIAAFLREQHIVAMPSSSP